MNSQDVGVRRLTLSAMAILAALTGTACYTYRPVTLEQVGAVRPGAVWLTRDDGSTVMVEAPRVYGDTLVGYVDREFQEMQGTEFKQMKVKRMAAGKTAVLLGGAAAGIATFAALVSSTGDHVDPEATLDCEDDPYQRGCPLAPPGL